MAKLTLAAVEALFKEHTDCLMNEIKGLKNEVASLKSELAAVNDAQSKTTAENVVANEEVFKPKYAEVVRKSVQSVIDQEKCKNDVMISKSEEKGQDQQFVKDLCEKLDFETEPIGIMRVGHKANVSNHHRLLKVSFANAFDARAFRARFAEKKKAVNDLPDVRMRAGRSREEQILFKEQGDIVYKMNDAAKKAGENASYSLRENGQIWKFAKNENEQWVRDEDWKAGN